MREAPMNLLIFWIPLFAIWRVVFGDPNEKPPAKGILSPLTEAEREAWEKVK